MSIFYDPQIFALQPRGGISKYIKDLMFHFSPFQLEKLKTNQQSIFHCQMMLLKIPSAATVLHHSYHFPLFVKPNIKKIVTIHDLIWEDRKIELNKKKMLSLYFKELQLKKADGVICVSETTYSRAVENYPFLRDKNVKIIKHGLDSEKEIINRTKNYFTKFESFILYVGNRSGYKNFKILLETYCHFQELQKKFNLVVVGGEDLSTDEVRLINPLLNNKIYHLQSVSDQELADLYRKAARYISTSTAEGFGYPVVEALQHRTLCICSDIPVYRELYSNFVTFFDPKSQDSLKDAILEPKLGLVDIESAFSIKYMIDRHREFYSSV